MTCTASSLANRSGPDRPARASALGNGRKAGRGASKDEKEESQATHGICHCWSQWREDVCLGTASGGKQMKKRLDARLSTLADAAFEQAARKVIERAEPTPQPSPASCTGYPMSGT